MATHSSVLVWRNPGTGEPGGLPSMGSHRELALAYMFVTVLILNLRVSNRNIVT